MTDVALDGPPGPRGWSSVAGGLLHRMVTALRGEPSPPGTAAGALEASIDEQPWRHPYLTVENLRRFRRYSEDVWQFGLSQRADDHRPLRHAFAVNMAQNMYTWARLARRYGADATLFPHPLDGSAISAPEWEDYDGEVDDALDGETFLARVGRPELAVPCRRIELGGGLLEAH